MKKYTKLFLATLCFISAAPVLAHNSYKGEVPLMPVTIPNFVGGVDITAGAIYMTPSSSNTSYLGTRFDLTTGTPDLDTWNLDRVDPNYKWGFVLGLGYVFPNTANDIRVDWLSFHNSFTTSDDFPVIASAAFIGYPGLDGISASSGDVVNASGKIDYSFDAVDLTLGQYINIGPRLQTRLIAGLRYARLSTDMDTQFNDVGPVTGSTVTTSSSFGDIDSSFNGLGPMFGIKGNYYLGNGFGLTGMIDAALLVGDLKLSASQQQFTSVFDVDTEVTTVTVTDVDNASFDSMNVVTPAFDAKFGLNYNYAFNNGMMLGMELGYQVTKYVDAVYELISEDGASPSFPSTQATNFGLNGAYLTFNLKI